MRIGIGCSRKIRFSSYILLPMFLVFFLLNKPLWIYVLFSMLTLFLLRELSKIDIIADEEMEDPDLTSLVKEIARAEGVKIKRVIVKRMGIFALVKGFSKTIVLSERLVKELSTDELKAIIYHELGHKTLKMRLREILKPSLDGLIFGGLMLLILLDQEGVISERWILKLITGIFCGLFFILFERSSYKDEYEADKYAAERTSVETMISALEKIKPSQFRNCNSATHPSFDNRILQLKKLRDIEEAQKRTSNLNCS